MLAEVGVVACGPGQVPAGPSAVGVVACGVGQVPVGVPDVGDGAWVLGHVSAGLPEAGASVLVRGLGQEAAIGALPATGPGGAGSLPGSAMPLVSASFAPEVCGDVPGSAFAGVAGRCGSAASGSGAG
ncbi:hypothetical protein [Actinoplanes palleronii]|uniref:hypothetical protein n=1 Tax=Actinoplanes palleronii TaxID=113570 RepID=UPI0019447634|nr:hypothetical protein [Actinoplanes palleronii]